MNRWAAIALAVVAAALPRAATAMADDNTRRTVEITITDSGPSPAEVRARPGEHLRLAITRETASTCVEPLIVNGIERPLPLGHAVLVEITARTGGAVHIRCGTATTSASVEAR